MLIASQGFDASEASDCVAVKNATVRAPFGPRLGRDRDQRTRTVTAGAESLTPGQRRTGPGQGRSQHATPGSSDIANAKRAGRLQSAGREFQRLDAVRARGHRRDPAPRSSCVRCSPPATVCVSGAGWEFTGHGFFTGLIVPSDVEPARVTRERLTLGFACDQPWPERIENYAVFPISSPRGSGSASDLEQVENAWDRGGAAAPSG